MAIAGATGTGTNAAFRYLIPSLAVLSVWVGRAWNARSRARRFGTVGLLAWLFVNDCAGLPDFVGWQNEISLIWGWSTGRPALVGDSLDWGQDLARLSGWISRNSHEGGTVVCVYGLGDGAPYGLKPPLASSTSHRGNRPAYLAVSENALFGYQAGACVKIAGGYPCVNEATLEAILRVRRWRRVGRTIRIYRIRDLPLGDGTGLSPNS